MFIRFWLYYLLFVVIEKNRVEGFDVFKDKREELTSLRQIFMSHTTIGRAPNIESRIDALRKK